MATKNDEKRLSIDEIYERYINQLDTLIPFLGLAREEIFDDLKQHDEEWFTLEQISALPNTFNIYRNQVVHGAFLLGYSYTETFVSDVIYEIYNCQRLLLRSEKQLTFSEIEKLGSYERVIARMIEKKMAELDSLESKIEHLRKILKLSDLNSDQIVEISQIRNALVHNSGRVNRNHSSSRFRIGEVIELTVEDTHDFGRLARQYAEEIREKANLKCNASEQVVVA